MALSEYKAMDGSSLMFVSYVATADVVCAGVNTNDKNDNRKKIRRKERGKEMTMKGRSVM
jgi:hypothetical protein